MSIQQIPFKLTSTAITVREDGNYLYNESGLLIPHEALRREMIRAHAAMEHFDPVAQPWRALYMKIWLKEFFVICVHEHHELEETLLTPEVNKLNIEIPEHLNGAHKSLLESMTDLERLAEEVLTLVRGNAEASLVNEKATQLKTCYNDMHQHMMQHFHDEEAFWLEGILKVGEKDWKRIEGLIKTKVQKTKEAEIFLCSILDSMGYLFKNHQFLPEDSRWCSEALANTLVLDIPYPVRAFIFPKFNNRYQRYKTMINAIKGDKDVLNLFNPTGTEQAGCACTIM